MLKFAATIWLTGIIFSVLHSFLSTNVIKKKCYAIGLSARFYRLSYVIIALATTTAWLFYIHQLPDTQLYNIEGFMRWGLYFTQLCGLIIFFLALKPIDVYAFLGLRKFTDNQEPFLEKGIYHQIRHPMYTGIMIIIFAMPSQSVNSIALFTFITVYFLIGSKFEERRMIASHPVYKEYRIRVPAFFPRMTKH